MNAVRSKTLNLTEGNVWKVLLAYSLPLFGSAVVQQVYSLADLLVVGNFAKEGALAVDAIGNATVIINILLAFALGANGGCTVIISRYRGENGFGFANLALKGLSVHGSYFGDCLSYLYIYVGSLPFVFMYNLGCGICSALGDSKTPFIFLVISSVLNVGLDLVFVWVLHLDVAGAAWATFISQAISCILTAVVVFIKIKAVRSETKPKIFDKRIFADLTVTSVPIILQQSFVSVGNFFVNKRINLIGEDATTGFTTAFKLVCMSNMGVVSMTNGLSNFASQNKAGGKNARVKAGTLAVLCYAMTTTLLFLAVFVSCPRFLTELFIQKDKLTDDAMAYSVQYLTIVSCFLPVVCVKIVSDGAIRGCGGNLGFTVSTFCDLVLRVAFVYILTGVGWGFSGVCWAWAIGWSISMFISLAFLFLIFRKMKG